MNNMRRGFTMIELVFVIVIIGILAAVALPRFTGIADDAHVSKLQAFVGTLNRTTGPSIWSGLQRAEPSVNGSVAGATADKHNSIGTEESALGIDAQVESIPSEFIGADAGQLADSTEVLALASCNTASPSPVLPAVGEAVGNIGILVTSTTVGTTTYSLGCIDSDLSTAPKFYLKDDTTGLLITK